ncbi:hypothetical protein [Desertibaculum subflavum]|uniref:hypothetical protein n=1 Tax=Desertibaculum subflavum TaxID=2268458 RepID=UPI0013C4F9B8
METAGQGSGNRQPTIQPRDSIVLSVERDSFAEFISSVLGKPQTIGRTFSGQFDLKREDIENFFYLVDHRVREQNTASIVSTAFTISYNNGSSITLNSVKEFSSYSETKPIMVIGVSISLAYLVSFPDRKHPEKQTIDVNFFAGPDRGDFFVSDGDGFPFPTTMGSGIVALRIAHTARSWGVDVENLLADQIGTLLNSENKLRSFIRRGSGKFAFLAALLFVAIAIGGALWVTEDFIERNMLAAGNYIDDREFDVRDAIRFLIENSARGGWANFLFKSGIFIILSVFASIAIAAWTESAANKRKPSFIVMSKYGEKHREAALARDRRSILSLIAAWNTAIISSAAGSALFAYLFQGWRP